MTRNKISDFEKQLTALKNKAKDDGYANALYASLCNMKWYNRKSNDEYSCTWRYAGGLVARLRNDGENYLDFYLNGNEGKIRDDVYHDLGRLGWKPKAWPGNNIEIVPIKRNRG
ncbi:MAG: hypothetical protein GY853_05775 [PVC group bacterium]|nr:hypothetical protein [PVC group bacterium]